MFGLNDSSNKNNEDTTQMSASDAANLPPLDTAVPAAGAAGPAASGVPILNDVTAPADSTASNPGMPPMPVAPPPITPNSDSGMDDVNLENAYIPEDSKDAKSQSKGSAPQPSAASLLDDSGHDELLKLKQQALQNLAPLVDHLDQTPEEKFKTTMMLIQASDNADLIPEAYEAAGKIEDDKVRAQALLDVVNEINYFTHHANTEDKES